MAGRISIVQNALFNACGWNHRCPCDCSHLRLIQRLLNSHGNQCISQNNLSRFNECNYGIMYFHNIAIHCSPRFTTGHQSMVEIKRCLPFLSAWNFALLFVFFAFTLLSRICLYWDAAASGTTSSSRWSAIQKLAAFLFFFFLRRHLTQVEINKRPGAKQCYYSIVGQKKEIKRDWAKYSFKLGFGK